ncbi:hypothetical protein T484DRAFT_2102808 [Baffinella frigidus]|nr:hypothetical protein T484DRAFT_2102808 [Cryptophyta sp. CCMP2293]
MPIQERSGSVDLPGRVRPARSARKDKRSGNGGNREQPGNKAPVAKPHGPPRSFTTPPAKGGEAVPRKGQDGSHLLNFRAPERKQMGLAPIGWRRRGPVSRFDKDRFMAANYSFVVAAGGDYSVHVADPDKSLDWESIKEVHVAMDAESTCPICLEPPTAARLTQCGHVYCWPCIKRLLAGHVRRVKVSTNCFEGNGNYYIVGASWGVRVDACLHARPERASNLL